MKLLGIVFKLILFYSILATFTFLIRDHKSKRLNQRVIALVLNPLAIFNEILAILFGVSCVRFEAIKLALFAGRKIMLNNDGD